MRYFCTKESKINILFLGMPADNTRLLQESAKVCKNVHREVCKDKSLELFEKYKPHIIVASYTYGRVCYDKTIKKIQALDPHVEIILLVGSSDCSSIQEILNIKASKYMFINAPIEDIMSNILRIIEYTNNKETIREDMQYFNALLEDSIVSKSDTVGNITYINENFTKITGYTKEECIGKNHNILRHPDNPIEIYETMWNTITKGHIWRERVLNKNKDGSDFWAETTIIPYKNIEGEIVEYIAIRRDITSMLKMKRKINDQEMQAQQQSKITEAKDSFLILFTHELKTPLNAIINFSKYLLKHVSSDTIDNIPLSKRQHLLEQINESAQRMLGDVSNILDISRIKSHKLTYNLTSFSIKEVILEVIANHTALAEENRVDITFKDDGSVPFITSDRVRVHQILANIISNAIKYSFGTVYVFLASTGSSVEIIVEDDGRGIKDKEIVFELFEQSGNGLLKKEKKGTGIGLNFVKLLCEDLNLQYRLEDSYDLGGLKFILTKSKKEN